MDNKEIRIAKSDIQEMAIMNAYAVVAILGLKEDEISEKRARELYGRGWIDTRTKAGLLHYTRKGETIRSPKVYSRFEIETLKRAEKHVEEKNMQAVDAFTKLENNTNNQ